MSHLTKVVIALLLLTTLFFTITSISNIAQYLSLKDATANIFTRSLQNTSDNNNNSTLNESSRTTMKENFPSAQNASLNFTDPIFSRTKAGKTPLKILLNATSILTHARENPIQNSSEYKLANGYDENKFASDAREMESIMFKNKTATCAIVGNSPVLVGSQLGSSIDNHDVVIRFNAAPVGGNATVDVGSFVTMRMLNNRFITNIVGNRRSLGGVPAIFRDAIQMVQLIGERPDGIYTDASHKDLVVEPEDFVPSRVFSSWVRNWGFSFKKSSGLFGVLISLQYCSQIDVYGFGTLKDQAPENPPEGIVDSVSSYISKNFNHYFEDPISGPNNKIPTPNHDWEYEILALRWLHSENYITVHPDPELLTATIDIVPEEALN